MRTLLRACELVGGETELARKLGAPERRVGQWLRGEADVPDAVFLQAADVVHAHSPQQPRDE